MKNREYVILDIEVLNACGPFSRTFILPASINLFDVQDVLALALHFDVETKVSYVIGQQEIVSDDQELEEALFFPLNTWVAKGANTMTFRYHGVEHWDFQLRLSPTSEQPQKWMCARGEGDLLLSPSLTHEIERQYYESQQTKNAMDIQEEPQQARVTLPINEIITELNEELRQLQRSLDELDAEQFEYEAEVFWDETESAHDPQYELLMFYVQIVGLSEEQAAYHILYETSLNHIIETLRELGYDDPAIMKTLEGKMGFESHAYEAIEHEWDILQSLPARGTLFDEQTDEYIEAVEIELVEYMKRTGKNTPDEEYTMYVDEKLLAVISEIKQKFQMRLS